MSLTKRVLKQRQFPEDEGCRDERLVSSRNKRNRYFTKLEKVIPYHTSRHLCMLDIFHLKDIKHQNSMSY